MLPLLTSVCRQHHKANLPLSIVREHNHQVVFKLYNSQTIAAVFSHSDWHFVLQQTVNYVVAQTVIEHDIFGKLVEWTTI